ncbi:MAG: hypothetical protein K9K38_04845 [Rhodoferax sp.]|nr:hypothetical protein [Rhodoferax sp.]MCF8208720.1 hypothetical protein [Rhodoferax sp.]
MFRHARRVLPVWHQPVAVARPAARAASSKILGRFFDLAGRQVQGQQAAQDFVVACLGGVVSPAVGGGNGFVEGLVGQRDLLRELHGPEVSPGASAHC